MGRSGMQGIVWEEREEPGRGCVQVTKRRKWVFKSTRGAQAKRLGQFQGLATRRSLVNRVGAVLVCQWGLKRAKWEQVNGNRERVISWRG